MSNNVLTIVYSDDMGKTWQQSQPITKKTIGQIIGEDGSDDLRWIADTQVTFATKTCGIFVCWLRHNHESATPPNSSENS